MYGQALKSACMEPVSGPTAALSLPGTLADPLGCLEPGLLLNNLGVQRGCLLMFDSMEPAHCGLDPAAESPPIMVHICFILCIHVAFIHAASCTLGFVA